MKSLKHAGTVRCGKTSAGVIILLVLVIGFGLLVGAFVLGVGVLMTTKMETRQAQVVEHRVQAQHQVEQALSQLEETRAHIVETVPRPREVTRHREAPRAKERIRVAHREITVTLDHEGKVELDGKAVEMDQLKTALAAARRGRESTLTVVVKADKRCSFEHVASVLSICKEIDVADVQIATVAE